jgi:flagellin
VGAVNLDGGSGIWLQNSSQDFEIATAGVDKKFTISGGADGMTKTQFLEALNTQLAGSGVSASTTAGGVLQLSSESGFVFDAKVKSGTGNQAVTTATTQKSTVVFDAGAVTDYDPDTTGGGGDDRVLTITVNGTALATTIAFNSAAVTKDTIFDQFRAATAGSGLEVIRMGDHMYLQSNLAFDVTTAFTDDGPTSSAGGVASLMANGAHAGAGTAPSSSDIGAAAKDALTKIGLAMSSLGTIQGTVGAGQNMLNYAISLAQSQISNFSSAESGIRDADVAAEAANLTKAQVLQQASMAAMAQANSAPQAVLALLRG